MKKYHNVFKFIMSGGLAALIEYSVFLGLHHLGFFLVVANALSFCCGLGVSFTLNKHWVFSHKKNGRKQFVMYTTLACINLVLGSGLILLFVKVWGLPPLVGKVCVMITIALWNYSIFQRIIFKKDPRQ